MKTFTVMEEAEKGIKFRYSKEGPNDIYGIPVGQGILKQFQDTGLEEVEALLHWVDVLADGDKQRVVKEQHQRDRRAIVAVETCPGVGGAVKLYANTSREWEDEKKQRVMKEPNPFPPPGITVLAERDSSLGNKEYLLLMVPGASFRIVRSGRLNGAPPELVVVWNGRWREPQAYMPEHRTSMANWELKVHERRVRHGAV